MFNPQTFVLVILVSLLGGFGAVLRAMVARWNGKLPWGILVANTLGSLVLGFAITLQVPGSGFAPAVIVIGVLLASGFAGGFTTFSTWAQQTANFVAAKDYKLAFYNLGLNLVFPIVGVLAGFFAASLLLK